MPRVIVVPHREVPGVYTFNPQTPQEVERLASVELHQVWDLEEALEAIHDTDAHIFAYSLRGVERCPRINKLGTALAEIRADGQDLLLETTALDWDTEGHTALDDASWAALQARIEALDPKPTFYYRTRAGARLLFTHDPVTPEDAERLHVGLVHRFMLQGFECDQKVWGWARESRLPNVLRDGKPLRAEIHRGPRLDHTTIERKDPLRVPLKVKILRLPHPTPDEVRDLIWDTSSKKAKPSLTTWAKGIQPFLKGRLEGTIDHLFDPSPRPVPTPRNDTVMRWAGCVSSVALLAKVPGSTPQHVYALLEPSIAQSDPHKNGRDLYAEAWKMILYCWAHEEAKVEHKEIISLEMADSLVQAIRKWPVPPNLPEDPTSQRDWIRRHAVVSVDQYFYVLQSDGCYSTTALRSPALIYGALRESGLCPTIIDLCPEGKDITQTEILNHYVMSLKNDLRYEIAVPRMWIKHGQLVQCAYHLRTDIKPFCHPDRYEWICRLFGKDLLLQGERHIAAFLKIERGPVAAMSLRGRRGLGKNMLVQGLVECFNNKIDAKPSVFDKYQYSLTETPIIHVEENWPSDLKDIPDKFRRYVGGTNVEINKKYTPVGRMDIAPRVIITANADDPVRVLFSHKGLDFADMGAVKQRLKHYDLPDDAAEWLEEKGGREFTRGWVGELGSPSDNSLAETLLWILEKHKDAPAEGRFLVEGDVHDPAFDNFEFNQDGVDDVGQALLRVLGDNLAQPVWVRTEQVQEAFERIFQRKPSLNWISRRLASFKVYHKNPNDERVKVNDKWVKAKLIDCEKVQQFAQHSGAFQGTRKAPVAEAGHQN